MNTHLVALLAALQVITLLALAVVLHKLRRVHLATYRLDELLTQTHQETHQIYPQLVAQRALEHTLGLEKPLPPMRGWAGSPDFLQAVTQIALAEKPPVIVECSSGVSTLVAARCCQLNGNGHVYSLEHEQEYAEKTRNLLHEHDLSAWATVVHAPLETGADGMNWYRDSNMPDEVRGVGLLVIDGPPQAIGPMARYPALPRMGSRLAPAATVVLDDAGRPDERVIVERWLREDPNFKLTRPSAEKGLAVLRRQSSQT